MKKGKGSSLWSEFKAFISKGSIIDLAVGVIIGGAFQAIVNAIVNGILMPIISWAIPSQGIDGIVTILNGNDPSVYLGAAGDKTVIASAEANGITTIEYWGNLYDSSKVNVINWGTLINAIIYFLLVAIFLFTVVKVASVVRKKREAIKAKELEKYYEKHPEERPKPAEPEAPKPTELDLLTSINENLKKLTQDKKE